MLHQVNFNQPETGLTGVIGIIPAVFARPASAEGTLAELRYRVGRITEITHVSGETMGVLDGRIPLLPHNRYLFFHLPQEVGRFLTLWGFLFEQVLFPECQAVPPSIPAWSASRTRSSSFPKCGPHPLQSL